MAALAKLQTLTGDQEQLAELRAEVEAAAQQASEEIQVEAEPVAEELTSDDIPTIEITADEAPEAIEETAAAEAEEVPVEEETTAVEPEPEPAPEPEPEPEPVATEAEPAPGALTEFVSDLESSLGDNFVPGGVAKPVASPVPPPSVGRVPAAATHAAPPAPQAAPVLGQFVADIEASLGEDFLKSAPASKPQPAAPAAKVAPAAPVAPPAVVTKASPAIAASAAASAAAPAYVAPTAPPSSPVAWPAPAVEAPKPHPAAPTVAAAQVPAPAPAPASPFGEEAGVDLAEMFGELKQDLEADVAAADEDPETHYNLGIAFREMGLLDEAIGELQKACQSFDRGHAFPQIMQAYTWLAQCFLDKGVPEAAVRWYEKALGVPTIDGETRVALNYELASAYETAGDKPSALRHFMDVYGANIDYRDVTERIKALKS